MNNEPKLYGLLVEWNGATYRVTGYNALKNEYSLSNIDDGKSAFVPFDELEKGAEIIEDEK